MAAYQNNQKVEKVGTVDFLTRLYSSRASELEDIAAFNFYGYGSVERMREGLQDVVSGAFIETLSDSGYFKSQSFLDAARSVGLDESVIARLTSEYEGIQVPFNELENLQIAHTTLYALAGKDGKLDWESEAGAAIKKYHLGHEFHDLVVFKHTVHHNPRDFTAIIGPIDNAKLVKDFNLDAIDDKYLAYLDDKPDAPRRPIVGGDKPPVGVQKPIIGGGFTIKDPKNIVKPGPIGPKDGWDLDDSQLYSVPRAHSSKNPELQKIIEQPGQGIWLTDMTGNPYEEIDRLDRTLTDANSKGQVPFVVSYFIKGRDVAENSAGGRHSAGGARNDAEWKKYYQTLSQKIGDKKAIVILEPDALGHSVNDNSFDKAKAIREALMYLREHNPNIKTALDIANSAWLGGKVNQAADMLVKAGMEYADFFTTNIAQFKKLENEVAYVDKIVNALEARGITGKKGMIDTSRNGNGPGNGAVFNAKDVALGKKPTFETGYKNVAAFGWFKTVGCWDGGSGIPAGKFVESYLDMLRRNAKS